MCGLTSDSQDSKTNKRFHFPHHQWMTPHSLQFLLAETNHRIVTVWYFYNVRSALAPETQQTHLQRGWRAFGISRSKNHERVEQRCKSRLTLVSSPAGLIAKADVVLLLEELRSTSRLPDCLCLQMELELPAIVCGVCPLVPDWRMLDILPAALARWGRC